MALSFAHMGLERLYRTGDDSGIQEANVKQILRLLDALDRAKSANDACLAGYDVQPVGGNGKGYWSLSISWSCRLVFRFSNMQVVDVDLVECGKPVRH